MRASTKIVKKYFSLKQKKNPEYSLRALARDIELSPSFVSFLINGKKMLPLTRVDSVAKALGMDAVAKADLAAAAAHDKLGTSLENFDDRSIPIPRRKEVIEKFSEIEHKGLRLFERWYYIAILELTYCSDFDSDPVTIAKRLNLRREDVDKAIERLMSLGFLHLNEQGRLQKTEAMIRLPTNKSLEVVRQFQIQMLELSKTRLRHQPTDEEYAGRYVNSGTISVNPAKIEEAKVILQEAMLKVADVLTQGECTEVYSLGVQLMAITK